jgi:UDP-glucose 4-epimerase
MHLFSADVDVRVGDIVDEAAVRSAVAGVDTVVHTAALLHVNDPPASSRIRYEEINVNGTRNVVDAALSAGVRRLVFFSTIAIYGPSHGQTLTEETHPRPDTLYGETKLTAESLVLEARRGDGSALGTVLRLAAVYGVGMKGNYAQLVRALARGRFVPIGPGHNRRTLVHAEDVADAALLAADHPAAAGRVYNVTDGQCHTLMEIIGFICNALQRPMPRWAVPIRAARFAAGALEWAARLVGRGSPVARHAIDKYLEDVSVAGNRIQMELGFRPRFDARSGWAATIADMRRPGEI